MTRNRFEYIDDVLVGVDTTPERVEVARLLLEEEYKNEIDHVSIDKHKIELLVDSLDIIYNMVWFAGVKFAGGDEGHDELKRALLLLFPLLRECKKWK